MYKEERVMNIKFPQYNNFVIEDWQIPFFIEWLCYKTGVELSEFFVILELSKLHGELNEVEHKLHLRTYRKENIEDNWLLFFMKTEESKKVSMLSEEELDKEIEEITLDRNEIIRKIEETKIRNSKHMGNVDEYFNETDPRRRK